MSKSDEEKGNPRRVCAAMPHHFYLAETDSVYRENRRFIETNTKTGRLAARTTIIRIPVVVHVLYHTDLENIELSQIESQIAALNRDYRFLNTDRNQIPAPFRAFAADTGMTTIHFPDSHLDKV